MFERIPLPAKLESELDAHFERTRSHFATLKTKAPEAIVLGGGYGRGEGGVTKDSAGEPCFFNDLDYFLFTESPNDEELVVAVHEWEKAESARMGIDVEGKCLPKNDLRQTKKSMMFYDLVAGHTIVSGPEDFLSSYSAWADPKTIAAVEATRLLWNRGTGLLFARLDLARNQDLSVVHRNQSKAKLALGDALLTLHGNYRSFARERHQLLGQMEGLDERIIKLHASGVAFKLNPTACPTLKELQHTQEELTELWLDCFLKVESRRLGCKFDSPEAYAVYSGKLYLEQQTLKNLFLSFRDRILRGGRLHPVRDYPRGALQRTLVLLLESEPDWRQVSYHLGRRLSGLHVAVEVYKRWWQYYS
jgi:hypothetical protein